MKVINFIQGLLFFVLMKALPVFLILFLAFRFIFIPDDFNANIESISFPVAFLVFVFLFRSEIKILLPAITKFWYKNGGLEFDPKKNGAN